MKKTINKVIVLAACSLFFLSCQKKDRPELGNYIKDANPPGGPLKFYAAYDGSGPNVLMNGVDSVRATFPTDNPFLAVAGITGKGIQCEGTKAIKYPSANDFKGVTSCTISLWVNNTVNPNTELYFSLTSKEYWHESAGFLLIENAAANACTFKFSLQDHWVEFNNASFNKPLLNGQWHHLAFSYDEITSKLSIYFDGLPVATPGTQANFTNSSGAPLGKLDLSKINNLVVGGWNKHAGISGPTDSWISGFSGKMDQFRLYGKALTATEVLALYNSKL
jgi:Concanavalin A-like lectin/glucanases superfamily